MFSRFLRNQRGNVLPIFAIAAVPLIVSTGAVVDYTNAYDQRMTVHDSMDAAALAAGKQVGHMTTDEIKTKADQFFLANIGQKVQIVPPLDTQVSGSTVDIYTELHVPTYFLGMIGLDEFVFNLHSQVTIAMGTLEVAMVLDNSTSMVSPDSTKIATLRTAAQNLVGTLFDLGDTSTKPDPVKIAIAPFAGSVNIGSDATWVDTLGKGTYAGDAARTEGAASTLNPYSYFSTLKDSSGNAITWAGCVEERPAPYDVQDDAPSTAANPTTEEKKTLFVPMFAPDESDAWTCSTSTCNYAGTSNGTRRYNGAPTGNKNYNNYLPDAGDSTTCGGVSAMTTVTMTKATPAVFSKSSHGLTVGTGIVINTSNDLYTGVSAGETYYVAQVPTTGTFTLTEDTSATNTTITLITGETVTISNAKPAVFTDNSHGLSIGDEITLTTTGSLPSGLSTGTSYYVATTTTNTFTVSATSGSGTTVTISKASPGVFTTSSNHGFSVGDQIALTTSGSLPSGLSTNTVYYIKTVPSSKTFTVAASSGGTAINTTSNGSGTHRFKKLVATSSAGSGTHRYIDGGDTTTVFTTTSNHGMSVGDAIVLKTTGSLPTGFTANATYYIASVPTTKTFTLASTSGGTAISGSGSQSGTHSYLELVATSGSQSGTQSYITLAHTAAWTCQSDSADCGGSGYGKSAGTAIAGINISANPQCKYGTAANKATVSSITVSMAGGPNFMCTTSAVSELSTDEDGVKTKIGALQANGYTNITAGVMWGWRLLSPGAPFTTGRAYSDTENQKILIVMTDGENTYYPHTPGSNPSTYNNKWLKSAYGAWGYVYMGHMGTTSGVSQDIYDKENERTALACANARAQGIKVYTVAFKVTDETTINMLTACATEPDMAYQSDNNDALLAAFEAIGDDISLLRIAQ